jgi:hypothetical protein
VRQAGYAHFVCTCGRRRARTARSQIVRSGRELEASGDVRFSKEPRRFGARRVPAAAQIRPWRSAVSTTQQTVEPLFGDTKHNSGVYWFHRRGRTKVRLEWRLLMMTHNLAKVHRHQLAVVGA